MSDDRLEQLRSVPLFAGLKDRELKDILGRTREVEHTGGEIVEEGPKGVGFHLILEGSAAVLQHGQVRRTLGPGDYFGEISMIDGKPRSATVRPEGPVRPCPSPPGTSSRCSRSTPSCARAAPRPLRPRARGRGPVGGLSGRRAPLPTARDDRVDVFVK